jgi:hypothetical protein
VDAVDAETSRVGAVVERQPDHETRPAGGC